MKKVGKDNKVESEGMGLFTSPLSNILMGQFVPPHHSFHILININITKNII
ncbi:MAG TPA: hypothetical protein VEY70_11445 [Metabacillus sp.]|nr:hypothetical protein [Metabacillus sp.]